MSYLPFFIIRVLLFDNVIVPARRHKDFPSAVNAEFSFVNRLRRTARIRLYPMPAWRRLPRAKPKQ